MKLRHSYILSLCAIIGFVTSCSYNNVEELYPQTGCDTDSLSYQNDIVPILENNGCIGCHGNTASLDIDGYDDLKITVDNGSLLGSIKHSDGFRPMPDFQPQIDQCLIDKIEAWIYDGAQNN